MKIVSKFLIEEVEEGFAYGYRGSLLARLAVAALHMESNDIARRAIMVRKLEHRCSMMPMESAAIIRGLLRVHNVTDAFEVLNDELSLPLKVSPTLLWNLILFMIFPHDISNKMIDREPRWIHLRVRKKSNNEHCP